MVSSGSPSCTPHHLPCKAVVLAKHEHACEPKRGVRHKGDTRGRHQVGAPGGQLPVPSQITVQSPEFTSQTPSPPPLLTASQGPGTQGSHPTLGQTGLPRAAGARCAHEPLPFMQAGNTRPASPPHAPVALSTARLHQPYGSVGCASSFGSSLISQFMGSGPTSGSLLSAQRLFWILCPRPPTSLSSFPAHSLKTN